MKKLVISLLAFTTLGSFFSAGAMSYLMQPTGQYSVGFQDFRLVDGTLNTQGSYICPGKTDLFYLKGQNEADFGKDNQINFCREVMIRVYYPTQHQAAPVYVNYYLPAINSLQQQISQAHDPQISPADLAALTQIKTFSIQNPRINAGTFPVLLFDPGSGNEAQVYENTITEMVSHGYIVVGINNTFIGAGILFPDGRVVANSPNLTAANGDPSALHDILFIRQALAKNMLPASLLQHMDLNHIGLFGHSLGGISVVETIRENPGLFEAAISYDAPPVTFGTRTYSSAALTGFSETPFLRLFAAEWRTLAGIITPPDAQFELLANNYYALLSSTEESAPPYYTNHMSFEDLSTLQYQPTLNEFFTKDAPPNTLGTANGWHVTHLVNAYTLQFFDMYLKNQPSSSFVNCQDISLDGIAHDTMLKCSES